MLQNGSVSKRHNGLDFVKYLCSFMVICIHTPYYGKVYLGALTRVAVPIFFMITGYFYSSIIQSNRKYMQLRKTIELFIYSNLLYFIWNLVGCTASNGSVIAYLHSILNIKSWIKFLCFNESLFSEHLWYLSALVYVLIIVLVFDMYSNRVKLYKFIPFLLLLNIILGNYSTIIFGVRLPLMLSRNFLFCGLPFFLLGDVIHNKQNKLTRNQLLLIVFFSILLIVAEKRLFLNIGDEFNTDCFIAIPLLAYSLFILALETRIDSNAPLLTKVAQLGKSASTTIYIIHPIAISIVIKIVNAVGRRIPYLNTMWDNTAPLIILILCTLFACCVNVLQKRLCTLFK